MTEQERQAALDALYRIQVSAERGVGYYSDYEIVKAALSAPAVTNGGLQDFACKVSDMLWGGELGWTRTGLDRMFNELKKRISSPAVPVIDGLDEAIKNLSDCKNASWVELNGKDVNDLMKLLKAARAYAELQKGA